ncbi:MAG: hypothetical protein ABUL62_22505 [Myxococcales bacterium]
MAYKYLRFALVLFGLTCLFFACSPANTPGGPGGDCVPDDCKSDNNMNNCVTAACIAPPSSNTKVCEFAATLKKACRCVRGTMKRCPPNAGDPGPMFTTCINVGADETRWDTCTLVSADAGVSP